MDSEVSECLLLIRVYRQDLIVSSERTAYDTCSLFQMQS